MGIRVQLHDCDAAPAFQPLQFQPLQADPQAPVTLAIAELMNPLTGEIVDRESIDELIDALEFLKDKNDRIYAAMCEIRRLLADRCEGDAITRRVAGKRRSAKVVKPDESFEQPVLKDLWERYPQLSGQYLKIATLGVQMKNFNKMRTTSSDQPDFVAFRDAMTAASKGRAGLPTVTVEQ